VPLYLSYILRRNGAAADAWTLLTYQSINHIKGLIAEAGLTYRTNTSSYSQRPKEWKHSNTYCTHCGLVHPALLPDHCQYTACSALDGNREHCLHPKNSLKISTFFYLNQNLIGVSYLLSPVALRLVGRDKISCQTLDIYVF